MIGPWYRGLIRSSSSAVTATEGRMPPSLQPVTLRAESILAIAQARHSGKHSAVRAAEVPVRRLHAVSDNPAPAMAARRREHVNRAFEAVEGVRAAASSHGETLVVIVTAMVATSHLC